MLASKVIPRAYFTAPENNRSSVEIGYLQEGRFLVKFAIKPGELLDMELDAKAWGCRMQHAGDMVYFVDINQEVLRESNKAQVEYLAAPQIPHV